MFITVEDTTALIPQRLPFIMIDVLMYADEKHASSRFQIREDNIFLRDGKLQEAGLVENIAQTAAAKAGYNSKINNLPVSIGYIGSINNLVVFSLPKINDQLETAINIVNQVFNVTLITGTVKCKEKIVAQCEMKIFVTQTK